MCMGTIAGWRVAGCHGNRPFWNEEISNDGWMVKCSDWVDNTPEGLIFFLPIWSPVLWVLPSLSGNLWVDHFGLFINVHQVIEMSAKWKRTWGRTESVLYLGLRKKRILLIFGSKISLLINTLKETEFPILDGVSAPAALAAFQFGYIYGVVFFLVNIVYYLLLSVSALGSQD